MASTTLLFGLGIAIIAITLLQTQQAAGVSTTREPNEKEQFRFFYDRNTNKMAMRVNKICYVLDLTPDEQVLVHTTSGIQQLELKMVYNINTATKTATTMDSLTALSKPLAHACGHTTSQLMMSI